MEFKLGLTPGAEANLLFGIVHTMLLEDFADNGDSRVDRVGDHQDIGSWAVLGHACCKITDDSSIDLIRERMRVGIRESGESDRE
jgi:hypothetical protein